MEFFGKSGRGKRENKVKEKKKKIGNVLEVVGKKRKKEKKKGDVLKEKVVREKGKEGKKKKKG